MLVTMGLAHAFVTVRLGVPLPQNTLKLQVARLVAVEVGIKASAPVAVTVLTMLLRPQRAAVTVKLALQGAVAPTANVPKARTVLPVKSSLRRTLVRVTLPLLLTMPLKPIDAALLLQRTTRLVLQFLVTKIPGVPTDPYARSTGSRHNDVTITAETHDKG